MADVYERLRQKLDRMTKGYPKTEKGLEMVFLKKVFSEDDAEFFIKFKPGLQTPEQVAEDMGMTVEAAAEKLESMSQRHLMYWERDDLGKKYRIIPFIHGFWEFNVDRIDQEDAKNMGQYYGGGYGKTFMDYRLPIARVVPIRADTVKDGKLLPDDNIEEIIKKQKLIVASDCACRKVATFAARPCHCTDEMNVCIVFGQNAEYVLETNVGHPRVISIKETLEILRNDEKTGLFLQASHNKDCSGFCNCAKCHCGILLAAKIHQGTGFDTWSNYKCAKDEARCTNCLKCADRCPMKAMKVNEEKKIVYNKAKCIGCGLCVTTCPSKALILERKPDDQMILPLDEKFFDNLARMGLEKAEIDKARLVKAKA